MRGRPFAPEHPIGTTAAGRKSQLGSLREPATTGRRGRAGSSDRRSRRSGRPGAALLDREELGLELMDCKIHMRADLGRSLDRIEQLERRPKMPSGLGKDLLPIFL